MLITDKFVYIHMPKTGGTFVTSVLQRLHQPEQRSETRHRIARRISLLRRRQTKTLPANSASRYGSLVNLEPKHGTCHNIPDTHRNKMILSNMRNPYDWYVSQYEFSWWKRTFMYHPEQHPTPVGFAIEQALPAFRRENPHFPEIAFHEFVDLCYRASGFFNRESGTDIGLFTHGFVRFFFKEPEFVIRHIGTDYLTSGELQKDMFTVHFLKTNHLNQELFDFLLSIGYDASDLVFLSGLGRVLPMGRGRRDEQNWESYYTPDLKALIREKDCALFDMFPEFDI